VKFHEPDLRGLSLEELKIRNKSLRDDTAPSSERRTNPAPPARSAVPREEAALRR
jgi:hypothetical protein